jgi:hypothetical protein
VGCIDGLSIGKERDVDQRLVALHLANQDLERLTDLLEAHTCIEQSLDDLELNNVAKRISAL